MPWKEHGWVLEYAAWQDTYISCQAVRHIYIYKERERERARARELYYKGLDYVIMEAEKSHDLLSASWRPRQVSGIIQSKCESLRTRGAGGVNPRPRTGED